MSIATPSVPMIDKNKNSWVQRINEFLDKHVLPYPVRYLTNRITILATLCLLIPLILLANVTVFVLAANSYLNVMSVVVSGTVLLYSTLSEARDRIAAERREQIAAEHQRMVDERSQSDSERIQEIHEHLNEMHNEVMNHINKSLDNIQELLLKRLETIQQEDRAHVEETHKTILDSVAAHREELENLSHVVQALKVDEPPADKPPKQAGS